MCLHALHDRLSPRRQKATCMYDVCAIYCLYFGHPLGMVLGCVMSKTKKCPISESDSDDSDAGDLDQVHVPCIVKLLQ